MDLKTSSSAQYVPRPSACWSQAQHLAPVQVLGTTHKTAVLATGSARLNVRRTAPRTEWKLRAADVASAAPSKAGPSKEAAIELLKVAAKDGGVPTATLAEAIRVLEKAKLQPDNWKELLGGSSSPGRSWRLVYTTGAKTTQKALGGLARDGAYFPITAVQQWDASNDTIQNGIYLGHVASFTFSGPFEMNKNRLAFDFYNLRLKLGPLKKDFKIKEGNFDFKKEDGSKGAGPFFTFSYVDDEICVARGRGGGVAVWGRTEPAWNMQAGLV